MIDDAELEVGRAVFREANDAFFIVHPVTLKLHEVNPAAQRLTGYRRKQLLDLTVPELFNCSDALRIDELVRSCQTTSLFISSVGFSVKTADQSHRAVHISVSRIHTEPETLALLIARDISHEQALLGQLINAQESERARVARELHDATGQSLTFLLFGLRAVLEASSLDAVKQRATELHRVTGKTLEEVQHLARALRPSALDDLGLIPALERLADDCRQLHKLDVRVDGAQFEGRLAPAVETTLYRIAQEAITNAAKHATPTEVWVVLGRSSRGISMSIRDNGCGFDARDMLETVDTSRHLGLSTMRERASLAGGRLVIDSEPGRGTTVAVELPN